MNIYMAIILIALGVNFILELIADILNIGALGKQLPSEFQGVYQEEEYGRSQEYTKVHTKFVFINSVFDFPKTSTVNHPGICRIKPNYVVE